MSNDSDGSRLHHTQDNSTTDLGDERLAADAKANLRGALDALARQDADVPMVEQADVHGRPVRVPAPPAEAAQEERDPAALTPGLVDVLPTDGDRVVVPAVEVEHEAPAAGAPVDQRLLGDTDVAASVGEPYALPQPGVEQAERDVVEQVATVRDEQSLNIANAATDGRAHFLRHLDGRELCGACGEAFPCKAWREEIEMDNLTRSAGQPVPNEDKARAVAELLGVSVEQARQIVLSSTPLDEL